MQGKVFAFGDPNSTSGYLIPSIEIPQEVGASMESGDYFGEVKFVGGHEQTIVAVANGDVDAGVTWADGMGAWEDGYNSGALRKASDAGLVDMNQMVEIWKSKPIPEGPIVLRSELPERVKVDIATLTASLPYMDADCAYNFMAGEALGFQPIDHDAYTSIIEARKSKM
jgi:phosphonate transport system substrate-binding protein